VKALAVGLSIHLNLASTAAVTASPHMSVVLEYLTVFILSVFVGIEVISKVPSILHTPLMSGSNAIHGVILVGAMLVLGQATTTPETVLGVLAVFLATLNVVGGFVVTDRMLEMFKGKPEERKKKPDEGAT
jgi:NAD(P) transhydrogenase subunit alpha